MHQEVVAMSFRVMRWYGGDGVCWHGQVHTGSKDGTLAHCHSAQQAFLKQLGLVATPTGKKLRFSWFQTSPPHSFF